MIAGMQREPTFRPADSLSHRSGGVPEKVARERNMAPPDWRGMCQKFVRHDFAIGAEVSDSVGDVG